MEIRGELCGQELRVRVRCVVGRCCMMVSCWFAVLHNGDVVIRT
jgi:hypothetical protein